MDLDSRWIKAVGPLAIAGLTIGVIVTGAYSTDAMNNASRAEPAVASPTAVEPPPASARAWPAEDETVASPAPLPDAVRYGAIETGPVAPGASYAERGALPGSPEASDGAVGGVAFYPNFDVASAPLQAPGYIRYLEVGAFDSRAEAETLAAQIGALTGDEERIGAVAVVHAPEAISNAYRVHIGPLADDVTNEDVARYRTRLSAPGAMVVSVVDAQER